MNYPRSGLPTPVNDIRIVHDNIVVPPYTVGEVWLYVPPLAHPLYTINQVLPDTAPM